MLNPGIRLLGAMKMPQKMLLIAVIFLIPIVYLLVVYERSLTARIEFSQVELNGVRQIAPVRKMIQNMQVHRGVSQLALAGNDGARAKLAEFRANIKAAIEEQNRVRVRPTAEGSPECAASRHAADPSSLLLRGRPGDPPRLKYGPRAAPSWRRRFSFHPDSFRVEP